MASVTGLIQVGYDCVACLKALRNWQWVGPVALRYPNPSKTIFLTVMTLHEGRCVQVILIPSIISLLSPGFTSLLTSTPCMKDGACRCI